MCVDNFNPDVDAVCPIAFVRPKGPAASTVEDIHIASKTGAFPWSRVVLEGAVLPGYQGLALVNGGCR